jgi:cyclic beta-1,2-glucan synthetase
VAVLALLLPMSELAVGMVNHLITLFVPPRVLPKLDTKDGVPAGCTTIVVMPAMLVRPESAEVLLSRLEIHCLANPDPQLRFALLTDFADAPNESMPEDEGYVRDALERVRALNERYRGDGPDKFFLFHRKRLWNPAQGTWMGWERKRGKLAEFNRLMRGDEGTSYAVKSAEGGGLPKVRFVITLDADTQMPRDTAGRMIGTLAHPLNQPRFDPALGRVVEGYGVLQPRVSFHLTAATHSRFAALLAASGGIDPYSTAASDAYMDLFGIGSFTGKGIYDLDAFEAATGHAFPENQILSHDLIEGNFARCGLLSDTELFDDFPARYHAYSRREHRWARGDWQILPWLAGKVPTADGSRENPLRAVERWKIFDNLRRSLVPPALVALLILGWTVLPGSPWLWTLAALAVPALPLLQSLVGALIGAARSGSLDGLKRLQDSVPPAVGQAALAVTFLADQAHTLVDAVARTLARLWGTRRNLLEWETAAATERRLGTGIWHFAATMWFSPALAVAATALIAAVRPGALLAASPILVAWFAAPVVAFWVSRPKPSVEEPLTSAERDALRGVARKTWLFFETFVGDEDNWLPPDNFQEIPDGRIAHRTSPTNQGLLLLSTLAAHDLGYIGLRTLVGRLEKTFDTFDRMETHWGHFYNWYDTRTLHPLPPAYISTVDSGNLLGCLLVTARGLKEKEGHPVLGPEAIRGIADAHGLVADRDAKAAHPIDDLLREEPGDLLAWDRWLDRLDWASTELIGHLRGHGGAGGRGKPGEGEAWAQRLAAQVRERRAELAAFAPWLEPLRSWEGRDGRGAWGFDEAAARWESLRAALVRPEGLAAVAEQAEGLALELQALESSAPDPQGFHAIAEAVRDSAAADWLRRLRALEVRARAFAARMDFRPLYKADRNLFAIGSNLVQGNLDSANYDLLASESCLTSFLTIARGEAPRRHWFQLGRPFIRAAGRIGLISWGGTMFEYLMPRLMLKGLPGTLVAEACRTAVARQVEYGRQMGVPWGISESAFSSQYHEGDYKYQAFGVPGLGLKRGLERDLVVAPYATAMATMIAPREALKNFRHLEEEGGGGTYGFYEAIDYTRDRLPQGQKSVIVRSYMAHHQGMGLVALTNAVLGDLMPRRFHAEPMVRAVELLLQERIPRDAPVVESAEAISAEQQELGHERAPLLSRRLTTPMTPVPRTHLLSNARYHVLLTNAGSGWSRCRDLEVTRWREDGTRDACGQAYYVQDLGTGTTWSAGYQPVVRPAAEYEVIFATDKASFRRRDGNIETLMEVTVSPEQAAEVRKITLTNHDSRPHMLELTSFVEVALSPKGADLAHPAFNKLFLETEWVPESGALLCRRRPRSAEQEPVWAVHVVALDRETVGASFEGDLGYETDRGLFLGRGRTPADPAALDPGAALSGTTGPVIDPALSLRTRVRIKPGAQAVVAFTTAVAQTREEALAIADQYHEAGAAVRAFELAWAQCQIEHRHHGWSPEDTHLFQRLASHLIFSGSALRGPATAVISNRQGQSALWRYGISGDRPIVLVRIGSIAEIPLARQLLVAHSFLRLKGLEFDLVLLNEEPTSYFEELHRQLLESVRAAGSAELADKPAGVFVRRSEPMTPEDRVLLQAVARVVLVGERGPLAIQLDRIGRTPALSLPLVPTRAAGHWDDEPLELPSDLLFCNGLGGFTADGKAYCILTGGGLCPDTRRNGAARRPASPYPALPPAPWINVVANPSLGFLASEGGSGFTWAVNSQANRLTPWSNDPATDPPGEVVYLRDEETGEFWAPTPLPIPSAAPTLVRHGQGFTTYERNAHGLAHELTLLVPAEDPIKLIRLKVRNAGDRRRRLSAAFFAEWVLGTNRDTAAMHVVTEVDPETGALLARNSFRTDFAGRIAFADVDRRPRTITGDRSEFLGRHGSTEAPAAMGRVDLSGRVGAVIDPCAALQVKFDLDPGESGEVIFLIGEADDLEAARRLVRRYREPGECGRALEDVRGRWDSLLGAVEVRTPDPALDLLVNRWLLYQVLSCRVWARSAFYQSGGAFGFRDQLQDVMALVDAAPQVARNHILYAASRQFAEGDVQHWWHPPAGQGVRTRFSDDYLWLPFVVCHYVATTGDALILDEPVTFLTGPALKPGQEDDYGKPEVAGRPGTLYEHCTRALDHGMRFGAHGLPLMGAGDWNDGMNRVGIEGRGESVWVSWFLIANLKAFAPLAESRGDAERVARCREAAEALRLATEQNAWDGAWYRRAYFDDGTPLGSSQNDECQIDSIAQTWGVISGAADPERAKQAMAAVESRLIKGDDGLILLFDPPFDAGKLNPGYIKGYLPGIRENGGQYTHAAIWVVVAMARLGRGREAFDLFRLLNPIHHGETPEGVRRYKVEPYVVAADVYGRPPHIGRGGWTWYTGSALLDVPRGGRGDPRLPAGGGSAPRRSLHPRRLAGLRGDLSPRGRNLPDLRGEPGSRRARSPRGHPGRRPFPGGFNPSGRR